MSAFDKKSPWEGIKSYFGTIWKWIDFFGQAALIIYFHYEIKMNNEDSEPDDRIEIMHMLALAALLLGRALHQLKIFKRYRYLLDMFTRVVYDMKDFLVILTLTILIFTILFMRLTDVAINFGMDVHEGDEPVNEEEEHRFFVSF